MADVRFEQATRIYPGNDVPAVDRLDLHIQDGEFMVLVGPSGSGKSTALRMLAGLEDVDEGGIWVGGRDVTYARPKDRDIAMVFQNYALYPYLTVAANIGFPLKVAKMKRDERDRRVREVAEMLGLADLLERKPAQLSGGQRQRVAMGRAIIRQPSVYLMDEPLSNLDAKLRVQMRADVASLQARLGVTTVYVTHDQAEAMTLGHRVAVLRDGQLQQCAAPRELYARPANTFVAGFIGSPAMSLCTVPVGSNGSVDLGSATVALAEAASAEITARGLHTVVVGLRPEALEVATEGIPARVEVVEELGADSYVFCSSDVAGGEARFTARTDARRSPERGERIALRPIAGAAHFFDPETSERLPD
jgi:multiple sugar transport system ATP-binding protein